MSVQPASFDSLPVEYPFICIRCRSWTAWIHIATFQGRCTANAARANQPITCKSQQFVRQDSCSSNRCSNTKFSSSRNGFAIHRDPQKNLSKSERKDRGCTLQAGFTHGSGSVFAGNRSQSI